MFPHPFTVATVCELQRHERLDEAARVRLVRQAARSAPPAPNRWRARGRSLFALFAHTPAPLRRAAH